MFTTKKSWSIATFFPRNLSPPTVNLSIPQFRANICAPTFWVYIYGCWLTEISSISFSTMKRQKYNHCVEVGVWTTLEAIYWKQKACWWIFVAHNWRINGGYHKFSVCLPQIFRLLQMDIRKVFSSFGSYGTICAIKIVNLTNFTNPDEIGSIRYDFCHFTTKNQCNSWLL